MQRVRSHPSTLRLSRVLGKLVDSHYMQGCSKLLQIGDASYVRPVGQAGGLVLQVERPIPIEKYLSRAH